MLYIFAIIKRNHFKMYMSFGVVGETHAHDYFEVISLHTDVYSIENGYIQTYSVNSDWLSCAETYA